MKGICLIIGEIWLAAQLAKGIEKFGEAKAYYEFGKAVKRINDDIKKKESE